MQIGGIAIAEREAAARLGARMKHKPGLLAAPLEILLVLLLADTASRLLWSLAEGESRPAMVRHAGTPPVAASLPFAGGEFLLRFDPFHRARTAAGMAAPVAESPLDLALYGIRSGPDGGSAIVRTPDKRQGVYRPGDEVIPGVRLVGIAPGMATIERDGRREGLYLSDDPERRRRLAGAPPPVESAPATADLLAGVRLRPHLADGRIAGVVIDFTETATILQRSGLISGDVLLAANGVPIDSVDALERLISGLEGSDAILVELEREGERRRVRVSFEG